MPSDKRSSSSSSSTSSSGESKPAEPEPETVVCKGDSSDNEGEAEVKVAHRCWNLMWTFSTPREYFADPAVRKQRNAFIPTDFTREEMAAKFREAVRRAGQAENLREMIVVMEPHSKWKPDRSAHEMHFHIIFRMRANFAHFGIAKILGEREGCKGHMSYPAKGWAGLVKYVLQDTAVKLPCHMDQTPFFWPDEEKTMTKEVMLQKHGLTDATTEDGKDWKEKQEKKNIRLRTIHRLGD